MVGIVQRETLSTEKTAASRWCVAACVCGWGRPLDSPALCSFCLSPAPGCLPGLCHHWLFLQHLRACRCQDARCTSAVNGSQFSQTPGYRPGTKRPSTFAGYKYLMFCEPVRLLLWTRLSITARSVPSSPADTLLIEAPFFP